MMRFIKDTLRICPKDTFDSVKKGLSYTANPFEERMKLRDWWSNTKSAASDLGKSIVGSADWLVKETQRLRDVAEKAALDAKNAAVDYTAKVLAVIPCYSITIQRPSLQVPLFDFAWNGSDWIAFLGGKYLSFPEGRATKVINCEIHHDGAAQMLGTAWQEMVEAGLLKGNYDSTGDFANYAFEHTSCPRPSR